MKSMFDVEIYAMAVGAVGESSVGAIRHVLEIVTETSILHLPITANILHREFLCMKYGWCIQLIWGLN